MEINLYTRLAHLSTISNEIKQENSFEEAMNSFLCEFIMSSVWQLIDIMFRSIVDISNG